MAEKAAHLVDHVFPEVPVRQWVLSLPHRIRYRLAYDKEACTIALRAFVRTVFTDLRRRAKRRHGISRGKPGGVTFIQRFASSLALNVHFHSVLLDGVYTERDGTIRFWPLPPPTDDEVVALTKKVGRSVRRALARAGKSVDEFDPEPDSLATDDPTLAALYGSSVLGRIATGARAGRQVERVGDRVTVDDAEQLTSRRCARVHGFSLHADVAVPARDRKRLERLSRYIARPPLANERLHQRSDGKLVYLFRKPWRDGTRGVVFTPAELIEKLLALIPPPQANLLRYHGVLAPGARLRSLVVADRRDLAGARPRAGTRCAGRNGMVPFTVPGVGKEETTSSTQGVSGVRVPTIFGPAEVGQRAAPERLVEPKSVHAERAANLADDGGIAALLSRELLSRESPTSSGVRLGFQTPTGEQVRRRMSWAELMKRVFSVDVLQCPVCQGKMKIIAEITQPKVIKRFLAALDLPYEAPVITQARPPPQMDFGWNDGVGQGPAVDADTNTTSY